MLLGRIELPASPLPRVRSTTELQQHGCEGARLSLRRALVKRGNVRHAPLMSNEDTLSREQRLAAKLRENLRRRKAQAKTLGGAQEKQAPASLSKGESNS